MKNITQPNLNVDDVYKSCLSNYRNEDLKRRLNNCKDLILDATTEFEQKIGTNTIHTILREEIVNGDVTAQELKDLYTNKMVPKKSPGREFYDKILISAPGGLCPYCSVRSVSNLDHYLPKGYYPRLSIAPVNLIPTCRDCNTTKREGYPLNNEEETFHPYFDTLDNEKWLIGIVVENIPITIKYECQPPLNWEESLRIRVKNMFKDLELAKLYSFHAASELTAISYRLKKTLDNGGSEELRAYLMTEAESRVYANENSWMAGMYEALSSNEWFLNGGFLQD